MVGVAHAASAVWPAVNGANLVSSGTNAEVRQVTDRYRAEWRGSAAAMPLIGMSRHLVVADTKSEAHSIARRCYVRWLTSILHLWNVAGKAPPNLRFPIDYDEAASRGYGIAGTPSQVRDAVIRDIAESGINYFLCRFAFGDMTRENPCDPWNCSREKSCLQPCRPKRPRDRDSRNRDGVTVS